MIGTSTTYNSQRFAGGLSQLAGASSVKTISSDGAAVGNVTGVQIGSDGMVTATFDNGTTRKLAQIAVATFPNPDGLTAATGNAYTASIASGQFSLKKPGEAGAVHERRGFKARP